MPNDADLAVVLRLKDQLTGEFRKVSGHFQGQARQMAGTMDAVRQATSRVVAALGGVLSVRFFARSIREAADFRRRMAEVSTLVDDSTVSFGRLGDELLALGREFGQPPEALTKGLYDALSAGVVGAADSMGFLRRAALFAQAGVTDVATSVDLMTTVLNAYGLSAEDAARVSDVLFQTVRLGKTTVPELAASMGQVASIASQAGVSIEEVGAALATMTSAGQRTEIAVTSLRGLLSSLVGLTDEQRRAAQELGFDLSLTSLRTKGLATFMRDLSIATKGNLDVLQPLIPNIRALSGVAALTANNAGKLAMNMEQVASAAGATDEAASKIAVTMATKLDRASAAWTTLRIRITEAISETNLFAGAVQGMLDLTELIEGAEPPSLDERFKRDAEASLRFARESEENARAAIRSQMFLLDSLQKQLGTVGSEIRDTGILGPDDAQVQLRDQLNLRISIVKGHLAQLEALVREFERRQARAGVTEIGLLLREGAAAFPGGVALPPSGDRSGDVNEDVETVRKLTAETAKHVEQLREALDIRRRTKLFGDDELAQLSRAMGLAVGELEQLQEKRRVAGSLSQAEEERVGVLQQLVALLQQSVLSRREDLRLAKEAKDADKDRAEREKQDQFLRDRQAAFDREIQFVAREIELLDARNDQERELLRILHDTEDMRSRLSGLARELGLEGIPEELRAMLAELENKRIKFALERDSLRNEFELLLQDVGPQLSQAFADILTDGAETGFDNLEEIGRRVLLSLGNQFLNLGIGSAGRSLFPNLFPSALGNVFRGGRIVPFARGGLPEIIDRPTVFPMAGGDVGLAGERGKEVAIAPLARTPGGRLGVEMVGGRGGDVNIVMPITIQGGDGGFLSLPPEKQVQIIMAHVEKGLRGRLAQAVAARTRSALV